MRGSLLGATAVRLECQLSSMSQEILRVMTLSFENVICHRPESLDGISMFVYDI